MILQRPPIDINSDGRMTRCDLWPQEVWFINFCRQHPYCQLVELQIIDGMPTSFKEAIARQEFEKTAK